MIQLFKGIFVFFRDFLKAYIECFAEFPYTTLFVTLWVVFLLYLLKVNIRLWREYPDGNWPVR